MWKCEEELLNRGTACAWPWKRDRGVSLMLENSKEATVLGRVSGGGKQGRGGLDDRDLALQSSVGRGKGLRFHIEGNEEPGMAQHKSK